MWGQKFGYVVGNALSFPFSNFSKIRGLYFYTLLVISVIVAIFVAFIGTSAFQMQSMMEQLKNQQQLFNALPIGMMLIAVLGFIIGLLSVIPYIVGIIRVAATGEQANSAVLSVIFNRRQLLYIWAIIKVVLVLIPIIFGGMLLTFLLALLFGGASNSGVGAGIGGFLSFVVMFFAIAIVAVRIYFTPVLAALDKGTSITTSWNMTRGNWWLIFLSVIVVGIIVGIVQMLVIFLGGLVIAPLAFILGPLMIPVGVVLYFAVVLFAMMPQNAALGYLYLVMTDQVKFEQPNLKIDTASNS